MVTDDGCGSVHVIHDGAESGGLEGGCGAENEVAEVVTAMRWPWR